MVKQFTQKQEEALRMLLDANGKPVSFWKLYDLDGRRAKYNGAWLPGFISAKDRHNYSLTRNDHRLCASNCPLNGRMLIERDYGPRLGRAYRIRFLQNEVVK